MGIEFNASALASKGLDGVLKDVYKSTGGNVEQITKLFGSVRSLPAVTTLGVDASGKFAQALQNMQEKTGSVDEAYQKMAGNFEMVNQNLMNNIRLTIVQVADESLDEYSKIVGGATEIFKAIGTSVKRGDFDPLFLIIDQMGNDIAETLSKIAVVLPDAIKGVDWSPVEQSFGNLKEMFSGLMDAIFGKDVDLTTVDGLRRTIQVVVDAFSGLNNVVAGIGKSWTPFIETFVKGLKSATDTDKETQTFAGNVLGLGQAINVIAGLGGGAAGVSEAWLLFCLRL